MSEESAKAFHKLVSAMRTSQKEFWRTRNKYALKQSIELEKRVDETIMEASASDVPDNENGKFFLEVAQLRTTTKLYFAEKKKRDADKEKINAWFKSIKEGKPRLTRCWSSGSTSWQSRKASASSGTSWRDSPTPRRQGASSTTPTSKWRESSLTTTSGNQPVLAPCTS